MAERLWYALDGTWHPSVASKMSALHLPSPDPHTRGSALCRPMDSVLFDDDAYTEKEAQSAGRTLCKRCLSRTASTRSHG